MRDVRKKHSVLLAEDDTNMRDVVVSLLQENGFRVFFSDTVRDTLYKLTNQVFDIILLDLTLKDGLSDILIHRVKTTPTEPNYGTPIVLMSGTADRDTIVSIRKHIAGVLIKPFVVGRLIEKVRELLSPKT